MKKKLVVSIAVIGLIALNCITFDSSVVKASPTPESGPYEFGLPTPCGFFYEGVWVTGVKLACYPWPYLTGCIESPCVARISGEPIGE